MDNFHLLMIIVVVSDVFSGGFLASALHTIHVNIMRRTKNTPAPAMAFAFVLALVAVVGASMLQNMPH